MINERITAKKKDAALKEGAELMGYIVKRGNSYQVIADGRARNLTYQEYRALLQYPDKDS